MFTILEFNWNSFSEREQNRIACIRVPHIVSASVLVKLVEYITFRQRKCI